MKRNPRLCSLMIKMMVNIWYVWFISCGVSVFSKVGMGAFTGKRGQSGLKEEELFGQSIS